MTLASTQCVFGAIALLAAVDRDGKQFERAPITLPLHQPQPVW